VRQPPVGPVDVARRRDQRLLQGLAPAQHRVEQADGGAARRRAERLGSGGGLTIETVTGSGTAGIGQA